MADNHRLLRAERGIIIAADVSTTDELSKLAELGNQVEEVVAIKVGFLLALRYSLPVVVETISKVSSLPVIYDHQKAATDIPAMGKPFAETCYNAGINGIIIFPQAGPKTMMSFIEAIREVGATPIVGGVMTHPAFLRSENGYIDDLAPSEIYRKAAENGVDHFVLPGNRPELILKHINEISQVVERVSILMPGIGTQGGQINEAFGAAGENRCYAIVGSAIYKAPDMRKALYELAQIVMNYEN